MLNSLDIVKPSYRDAILASPGLQSYWRSGEQTPTVTVATLVNGAAAVPDVSPAVNEVQTITIANANAGTFTVTFGANTTSALAWNCTAAQMQTALTGLASIGANNATVTLSGFVYTVTFVGALAGANQAAMTATGTGLTVPGLVDSVGGITGTLAGGIARHAVSLIANDFEGSADYNGTTGTVSFGDVYDFAGTVPFTVMCWVQPDTFPAAANRILSKWASATGGWRLYCDTAGALTFDRRDSSPASDTTGGGVGSAMIAGRTYQLTCTYDGTVMRLFRDAQGGPGAASSKSLPNTATALTVASQNSAASSWFDGRIDEIAIWNRALAASEILDLYWIGKG